jgi:hypothetical protein
MSKCKFVAERCDFVTYECTAGEESHEGPHRCHDLGVPSWAWHPPAQPVLVSDRGYWLVPEEIQELQP